MTAEQGGGASRSTDPAAGSSAATDVSLREHLERTVALQIGYESKITKLFVGFACVAGAFGWSQIQRRLEILNHENARVAAIAVGTVSSDTYKSDKDRTDDERDKLDTWRSGVDEKFTKSISRDELQNEVKIDRRGNLTFAQGLILTVVSVIGLSLSLLTYHALRSGTTTPTPTITVTSTTGGTP